MQIIRAKPKYRPVTIIFETRDELDKFIAIIQTVASGNINPVPQIRQAAIEFDQTLGYSELNEVQL